MKMASKSQTNQSMRTVLILCVILMFSLQSQGQITRDDYATLQKVFHQEYDLELILSRSFLTFNVASPGSAPDFWWNQPIVRAAYSSHFEKGLRYHNLFLMRGYAELKGMTLDGVAATLCHELGHGLGGAPYKDSDNPSNLLNSVEGQADYFAYSSCLPRIFAKLAEVKTAIKLSDEMVQKCKLHKNPKFCERAVRTLEAEKVFFLYEDPDTTVSTSKKDQAVVKTVNTTNGFYISHQCRMDTMIAGIFQEARPRCWFAP